MPIPVFRVEKNANYTTMSNFHLRDKTLSLKAKGLLSMLLSLPESWNYSVRGLATISREGKDGILSALQELEKNGYLVRKQRRGASGKMEHIEYVIFEQPKSCSDSPGPEKPYPVKPDTVPPNTALPSPVQPRPEETPELRKDKLNTDKRNTELKNHRGEETLPFLSGVYENVPLSQSEVEALKSEFPTDWEHRINRLSEYMASTGKRYENHLATIRSWARQDAQSSDRYQHGIYAYDGSESL